MTNATGLSILSAAELLAADIAPRRDLLAPLLASDGAALVYGPAGIGKSFFALSLAWAVAGGGSFLGWQSPRPHRVLYVDGEMGAAALRERLALFGPPPAGLAICPHDLTQGPLLDLAGDDGPAAADGGLGPAGAGGAGHALQPLPAWTAATASAGTGCSSSCCSRSTPPRHAAGPPCQPRGRDARHHAPRGRRSTW